MNYAGAIDKFAHGAISISALELWSSPPGIHDAASELSGRMQMTRDEVMNGVR
jgi:hypothetical protein